MPVIPQPRRALILAAVVVVAALAATAAWRGLRQPTTAAPAQAPVAAKAAGEFKPSEAQWAALAVEAVKPQPFDSVLTMGGSVAVNDNATATVFSQFSGRVQTLYAQPGQRVAKGAPLLSLLATEVAQSRGDLAVALAAQATAQQQLELARLTERRQHELLLAQAGAEKDWLQSRSDLAAAEIAERAAQAALAMARDKAAVLTDAPLERGERGAAALITAPIAGVVIQRQVAPGQYINSLASGATAPLYTLSDLRTVWVLGSVAETDALRVQLGQPVEVTALALPGRALRSRVAWISSTVDPATRRVTVRAELANADAALKPQMSVTMRVLEAHPAMAVAVPRSALVYEAQHVHCYVATADHKLVARELTLGRVQGEVAEVKAGLAAGEQVVTRGALFIDRAAQEDAS